MNFSLLQLLLLLCFCFWWPCWVLTKDKDRSSSSQMTFGQTRRSELIVQLYRKIIFRSRRAPGMEIRLKVLSLNCRIAIAPNKFVTFSTAKLFCLLFITIISLEPPYRPPPMSCSTACQAVLCSDGGGQSTPLKLRRRAPSVSLFSFAAWHCWFPLLLLLWVGAHRFYACPLRCVRFLERPFWIGPHPRVWPGLGIGQY